MSEKDSLLVETVANGPFVENCFIVADAGSREAIVIDPGDEETRLLEIIRRLDLNVKEIVNTHGHIDHSGAVAPLKRLLGVPFAIHPGENVHLERLPQQAAMFGLPGKETPEVDRELAHDQILQVGALNARVIHTPGHSAGGCCFHFASEKIVFVGDTLFAGSIGRTDLPGGSLQTLLDAIKEHLLCMPDDTLVYSGHGPETTIGAERRSNPFLQPGASFLL